MRKERLSVQSPTANLIYKSEPMGELITLLERVGSTDASVVIQGESGSGKELVAKALHLLSQRMNEGFIAMNCAAIPETLVENVLFGHEKGVYTGAVERTNGQFELAHRGTLFLDEIGEMPLSIQPKLLRALQEREIVRVGGVKPIKTDVRIVCATNKDLKACVKAGTFREDLFYRLNVFPLQVPPLRERREDIVPIAEHFIERKMRDECTWIQGATKRFRQGLVNYDYPGNVRELENILYRTMIRASGPLLDEEDLPWEIFGDRCLRSISIPRKTDKHDDLMEKVKEIIHRGKPWYRNMRCTSINDLCRFLVDQGQNWFSRARFHAFLQNGSSANGNRYKSAGVYLGILKRNGILIHNGKNANQSLYRVAGLAEQSYFHNSLGSTDKHLIHSIAN